MNLYPSTSSNHPRTRTALRSFSYHSQSNWILASSKHIQWCMKRQSFNISRGAPIFQANETLDRSRLDVSLLERSLKTSNQAGLLHITIAPKQLQKDLVLQCGHRNIEMSSESVPFQSKTDQGKLIMIQFSILCINIHA